MDSISYNKHWKLSKYAPIGDERLNKRMARVLSQLQEGFGKTIPEATGSQGQMKACYRFMNNKRVASSKLIEASRDFSIGQQREISRVLAVQDTSPADYTNKRAHKQLGCLDYEHQRGLFMHNQLLLTTQGVPLGILGQESFNRDIATLGKAKERKYKPIEEKESYRWIKCFQALQEWFSAKPTLEVIQLADREADIHELLQARQVEQVHFQARQAEQVHYIIRSKHDRKLVVKDNKAKDKLRLCQHLQQCAVKGSYRLKIKDPKTGKARKAHLQLRYSPIEIQAGYRPKGQQQLANVKLWVVEVQQVDAAKNVTPVSWRLLTSLPVETLQEAKTIVRYYSYRWKIESFHFVLKQGLHIEELQLATVEAIRNAIALYSIVALQVLQLREMMRACPHISIYEAGIDGKVYKVLVTYMNEHYQTTLIYDSLKPPSIEEFLRLLAQLGGSMLWKGKMPGVVTIWRGWQKLQLLLKAYRAFNDKRCG